jgi:hypothetical protein
MALPAGTYLSLLENLLTPDAWNAAFRQDVAGAPLASLRLHRSKLQRLVTIEAATPTGVVTYRIGVYADGTPDTATLRRV